MAAHWRVSAMAFTLLLLNLNSHIQGTEMHPDSKDRDSDTGTDGSCPFMVDTTYPPRVKVDMKVSSGSYVQTITNSIRSRSTSPWGYSTNVDNNRSPSIIHEARCLHKGCVDSQGNVDLSMNSVPIRQEILVLRREMRGCIPVYKLDKQLVTVGCTCVRPVIQYIG